MAEPQFTSSQQEILKAIAFYTFATIDQIIRHIDHDPSAPVSLRYTQVQLKTLVEQGHIDRIDRSQTGIKGKLKPAYRLLKSGLAYVNSQGITAALHDRPTTGHLDHVLAVNDVILLAIELARLRSDIKIVTIKHDFELRIMQLSIIPDAFIYLVAQRPKYEEHFPFLIEVDRGTESQTVIGKKIEAYLEFMRGEYQNRFNLKSATIVWFITGDSKRLLNIREVIEDALTRKNLKRLGQFFYLGRLDNETTSSVFLSPYFYVPYKGDELLPLLANPPPIWMEVVNGVATPRSNDTIIFSSDKVEEITQFQETENSIPSTICPYCQATYSVEEAIKIYDVEIREWECECGMYFIA